MIVMIALNGRDIKRGGKKMIKKGQLIKVKRPGTNEFDHIGKVLTAQKKLIPMTIKNLLSGEIEYNWECYVELVNIQGKD